MSLASLAMFPSTEESNRGGLMGAQLNRGRNQIQHRASSRAAASTTTEAAQERRYARLSVGTAWERESTTAAKARVRMRVARPVEIQVEDTKPRKRATTRTGACSACTGSEARASMASRIRRTVAGGIENDCVARSTQVPKAWKACTA